MCDGCWTWNWLDGERCAECRRTIDVHRPDPHADVWRETLGRVVEVFGGATVTSRASLPCRGVMGATETGLFFLPCLQRVDGGLELEPAPPPARIGSAWTFPWRTRRPSVPAPARDWLAMVPLETELAERHLQSPGGMFIPANDLFSCAKNRAGLTIQRRSGALVTIRTDFPGDVVVDCVRNRFRTVSAP